VPGADCSAVLVVLYVKVRIGAQHSIYINSLRGSAVYLLVNCDHVRTDFPEICSSRPGIVLCERTLYIIL